MIQTNCNRHIRRKFGKTKPILDTPDLLEIQKEPFEKFLQKYLYPDKEGTIGLQSLLERRFPINIESSKITYSLEFESCKLHSPPQTPVNCKRNNYTYGSPLKVLLRLKKEDTEIDKQWCYLGVIPLMTDNGSFIINGSEKVVINQFYRSAGVFFNNAMRSATITPKYGSKIEILSLFKETLCFIRPNMVADAGDKEQNQIQEATSEPATGKQIKQLKAIAKGIGVEIKISDFPKEKVGRVITYFKKRFPNNAFIEAIPIDIFLKAMGCSNKEIDALFMEDKSLEEKPEIDKSLTEDKAKLKVCSLLGIKGTPTYKKNTINPFDNLFFDPQNYSLGKDGRFNINQKLNLKIPLDVQTLTKEDILKTTKYLFRIKTERVKEDDIDHLGNKRIRTADELIGNHFRKAIPGIADSLGSVLKDKTKKKRQKKGEEKPEETKLTLEQLIDIEVVQKIQNRIDSFFIHNELCQFLEQDNPLTDITHKRRLTVLGLGGLKKDKVANKVKQVHPTHYSRVCPVETPEGPNVGQISSLSIYARLNECGFIETPYRKVNNGKVTTNKIKHLSAFEEDDYTIAVATEPVGNDGRFINEIITAHRQGELVKVKPEEVDYVDISPSQVLSLSASLIPFMENTDPNRALMASNMQRQAVPLLKPEAPLIGTGTEELVARNSGAIVTARRDGIVMKADANHIIVQPGNTKIADNIKILPDIYKLIKHQRTNQGSCINQHPVVEAGDKIKKGETIADGHSTKMSELALGKNLLVAFMPWRGYNFEDAILINENIVKKDYFTSISIEEYRITVREKEELTTKIAGVKRRKLRHLKKNGIVRIGSRVSSGDILVGKKMPRGRKFTLEERMLRDILHAEDPFDDTSLRVPLGVEGTVIDVRIKEEGLSNKIDMLITVTLAVKKTLSVGDKMAGRYGNKGVISKIIPEEDMPFLEDGTSVDIVLNSLGVITRMNLGQILETHLGWAARELGNKIKELIEDNYDIKNLKKLLRKIYPEGEMFEYLNTAKDEEILSLAERLSNGIPMESPAFDGATEKEIEEYLKLAGLPEDGKTILYDGITGECFSEKATVGTIYMMKLHHLAEDKMHARSTGDYLSITQQPKEGKADFGGQRLGEMEAWALYGYGAAHTLRESLTIKSDDINGRNRLYKSIVNTKKAPRPHLTEAFKVLLKELRGLCFDVSYIKGKKNLHDEDSWTALGDKNLSLLPEKLNALKIGLASPETIRAWSHGEVVKTKIMDYRGDTFVPDGLFCEKIFGPTRDYYCACPEEQKKKKEKGSEKKEGKKYKGLRRYKGETCDKCGVDILEANVRRERMGRIELATPVLHTWFSGHILSLIKDLFDITDQEFAEVIDYKSYIVINPGNSKFKKSQPLSTHEYKKTVEKYGNSFKADIGAKAIRELLRETDIEERCKELEKKHKELEKVKEKAAGEEKEELKKQVEKLFKRITALKQFLHSEINIEHIFLEALPVIPPEFRPYAITESGVTISSDLNMLYQKVIGANNQVKKDHDSIDNKKRLQKMVDGLLAINDKQNITVGREGRPLKTLKDQLKGKEGRFRENLLGKRVDYSGRTVIVSGPELKLHQCGLPKEMAIELFKPFIYRNLIKKGVVKTPEGAKSFVEKRTNEVWETLNEVIEGHPVLLNRNPSLHRMNIQAFEPVLVDEEAIKLHPMVCASYAADFDGDTMAVHVPLTPDAIMEAMYLLKSTNNILSPATGKPIVKPSQDMVLGIYYMTKEKTPAKGEGKVFSHSAEVETAFNNRELELHAKIRVRIDGELIETTTGRILLKEIVPPEIPFEFYNQEVDSRKLSELISLCYRLCGQQEAVLFCDRLKELGFEQATLSGVSFGIKDVIIPDNKQKLINKTYKKVDEIEKRFKERLMNEGEKTKEIINAWQETTNNIEKTMKTLAETPDTFNPLFMMVHSGARGNTNQLKQLAGIRGLMANSSGDILEQPIVSNLKEGQNAVECFISTYGARNGLIAKNKSTQDAGYFTRRLVFALQNCIINEEDCGSNEGINISLPLEFTDETNNWVNDKVIGRIAFEDIKNPSTGEIICRKNKEVDEGAVEDIKSADIREVKIRSPLTCKAEQGICALCYGHDLSRRRIVNIGEAVGIIAAQSLGEPGTQFSIGAHKKGITISSNKEDDPAKVEDFFKGVGRDNAALLCTCEGEVKAVKDGKEKGKPIKRVHIIDKEGNKKTHIVRKKEVIVSEGDWVKSGDPLTEGEIDPYKILQLKGRIETAEFLIGNIQEFFKRQGANVNRKHFEIVLSEMLKHVKIVDSGDTDYFPGEEVEKTTIEKENERLVKNGKKPAVFEPVLSKINSLASSTDGFFSAASFERTPSILAQVALEGRIDYLKGIQENVILGRLIPVGTGHPKYPGFEIKH